MSTTCFVPKIALVGSGMIGGTVALLSGLKDLSTDIRFLDVVDGMPSGKALDLSQALTCENISAECSGHTGIGEGSAALKDADVVIVTAGFPRKPGMSRDDLLSKNAEVITDVGQALKAQCPNAFVICITNPLDVMVALLQKVSGIPANRVVGMAGLLDSSRFRSFLADAMKVSVRDVQAMVMGGHGDDMVPVISATSVAGVPLSTWIKMGTLSQKEVDQIVARTRNGGGEIVSLLKMGSAFVAPAVCAVQMAKSYIKDEKRVIPCCAMLTGQYGIKDSYGGVPCVIGKSGVERIIELPLEDNEKEMFAKSMESVQVLRKTCATLGFSV